MQVKATFHVYCRLNLSQLWLQTCAVEVKLFCGLGVDFCPCRYRGELQPTVSSFPRLPSTTPPRVCARSSLEKKGDWGRSGGAEWWVTALECARAPNSLCSRRSRRHSARAARDRSGSARRRQDNAAGAGGMMAVSEKKGQV